MFLFVFVVFVFMFVVFVVGSAGLYEAAAAISEVFVVSPKNLSTGGCCEVPPGRLSVLLLPESLRICFIMVLMFASCFGSSWLLLSLRSALTGPASWIPLVGEVTLNDFVGWGW